MTIVDSVKEVKTASY